MNLHSISKILYAGITAITLLSCKKEAKLELNFSDKFEGKRVELMNYADSTLLAEADVHDGKAEFVLKDGENVTLPLFTNIQIDGRIRAFYVAESGTAYLSDSLSVASGTPLNDKFTAMLSQLDSIENLDDMNKYVAFAELRYNENKENPLGDYFCIELLKYADPTKVDSLLQTTTASLRTTKRVKHYEEFAHLRQLTSPGRKYTDFSGEDARGKRVNLSTYIKSGNYVLVDFWASWCPYCIKELPEMKTLYEDYHSKGFDIVGVAVRDKVEDTRVSVEKHELPWSVMYNTQKGPYDIYGFSGIPHHMLIGPDGVIISRGENIATIREQLQRLMSEK